MFDWPHRTYCDTLEEQRKLVRTISIFNYKRVKAMLMSLIEENQTYGNRMEAGLHYKNDLNDLHKERKKLQAQVDELKDQVKVLKEAAGEEVDAIEDEVEHIGSMRNWRVTSGIFDEDED